MSVIEIVFLGLILSIDAFLVSFSYGTCKYKNPVKSSLAIAFGTGLFQFLMPIIGANITNLIFSFIQNYANYIAGIILIILGIKIFLENCKAKNTNYCSPTYTEITWKIVLTLSVATSIDALAAGSSLYLLKVNIFIASLLIGVITFFVSTIGFYLGKNLIKYTPEVLFSKLGGIILVYLGIKTIFL